MKLPPWQDHGGSFSFSLPGAKRRSSSY